MAKGMTKITAVHLMADRVKLAVLLDDSRVLFVPLAAFPRLERASEADILAVRITGGGHGLRWDSLDEDLSISGLAKAASETA